MCTFRDVVDIGWNVHKQPVSEVGAFEVSRYLTTFLVHIVTDTRSVYVDARDHE